MLSSQILYYGGLLKTLNNPAAAIMFETKCIPAGITFGPVDPSAFNGCYNTVPAGGFPDYLVTKNIFSEFHSFNTGDLALVAETINRFCLRKCCCRN
jgi:hypothetical protein